MFRRNLSLEVPRALAPEPEAMMVPGRARRLTQDELADPWRMSPRSLERWRTEGFGPEWIKMPGRVLYRIEDVTAFERRQLRGSSD